jgi:hypothetical protein
MDAKSHGRLYLGGMTHPAALPHGPLEEIFPDTFFVTGTSRPNFMGADWQFSRNMTVLRRGDSLTLVNTVRLDEAGLAALDALGRVTQVVRLGAFHGMDDAFYLARTGARYFSLAGAPPQGDRAPDALLSPDAEPPVPDARVFLFETSKVPEALLWLPVDDGVLISCDSLQNWVDADGFFDAPSAERMRAFGFIRPANVGPGWRSAAQPEAADFRRILELPFRHLLPAHGVPLLGDARAQLAETFAREFGV